MLPMESGAVSQMVQLTKRHYQVWLGDAQCLQLQIDGMFDIQVTQGAVEIARIHFQPLSSLNNLEMPPVYRVASYQLSARLLAGMAEELLESALVVYAYYTRGSIRPWRGSAETVTEQGAGRVLEGA